MLDSKLAKVSALVFLILNKTKYLATVMRKSYILSAIFLIAVLCGLVAINKKNHSQPQPEQSSSDLAASADRTEKNISAFVKLVPTIGTNIGKPGQFDHQHD